MANLNGFDSNDHGSMQNFDALPEGEYLAVATSSEMKNSKKGGEYLEIIWEILTEEHKGRLIWARLNLKNSNPKAEEIAMRELADICRAVGIQKPKDSEELHNKPCLITLGIEEQERDGKALRSNRIKKYASVNAPAAVQTTMPTATAVNKAPWKR